MSLLLFSWRYTLFFKIIVLVINIVTILIIYVFDLFFKSSYFLIIHRSFIYEFFSLKVHIFLLFHWSLNLNWWNSFHSVRGFRFNFVSINSAWFWINLEAKLEKKKISMSQLYIQNFITRYNQNCKRKPKLDLDRFQIESILKHK